MDAVILCQKYHFYAFFILLPLSRTDFLSGKMVSNHGEIYLEVAIFI